MTVHCCQLGGCRGLGGGPPQRTGHRQCPHPRGEEAGEEGRVRQGEQLTNHRPAAGHVTPCSPPIGQAPRPRQRPRHGREVAQPPRLQLQVGAGGDPQAVQGEQPQGAEVQEVSRLQRNLTRGALLSHRKVEILDHIRRKTIKNCCQTIAQRKYKSSESLVG